MPIFYFVYTKIKVDNNNSYNIIMKKTFLIATALALVVPFVASANIMGGDKYGKMGFGGGFMFITWVVWLAVGILTAIWLWKQINKKG